MATIAELKQALIAADAAGNADDARALAQEIARQAGAGPAPDPVRAASPTLEIGTPFGNLNTRIPIPQGTAESLAGAGAEMADWGRSSRRLSMDVGNALGLVSDDTLARVKREDADKKALDAPLAGSMPGKVGSFTANAAASLMPTQTVRGAAALGGTLGALAPADTEWERVRNVLLSGALGAAGQALGEKIAAMLAGKVKASALSPDELSIVREAQRRGYDLTPAQITKSKAAQSLETQLASLPGSAAKMAERRGAQSDLFAKELFGTMGEQADQVVAPGTTANIRNNFVPKYAAATNGVRMTIDDGLVNDAAAAFSRPLTPAERRQVKFYVDAIPSDFDGAWYQSWRSRIGAAAEGAKGEYKLALKDVQRALDSAFYRQAPQAAQDAMTKTRGEYRNFKTLLPLIENAEARGEAITPLSVARRVGSEGNLGGELADMSRIGQVIGKQGPNSGTSQNEFWRQVLTGSAPLAGAGARLHGGGDPSGVNVRQTGWGAARCDTRSA